MDRNLPMTGDGWGFPPGFGQNSYGYTQDSRRPSGKGLHSGYSLNSLNYRKTTARNKKQEFLPAFRSSQELRYRSTRRNIYDTVRAQEWQVAGHAQSHRAARLTYHSVGFKENPITGSLTRIYRPTHGLEQLPPAPLLAARKDLSDNACLTDERWSRRAIMVDAGVQSEVVKGAEVFQPAIDCYIHEGFGRVLFEDWAVGGDDDSREEEAPANLHLKKKRRVGSARTSAQYEREENTDSSYSEQVWQITPTKASMDHLPEDQPGSPSRTASAVSASTKSNKRELREPTIQTEEFSESQQRIFVSAGTETTKDLVVTHAEASNGATLNSFVDALSSTQNFRSPSAILNDVTSSLGTSDSTSMLQQWFAEGENKSSGMSSSVLNTPSYLRKIHGGIPASGGQGSHSSTPLTHQQAIRVGKVGSRSRKRTSLSRFHKAMGGSVTNPTVANESTKSFRLSSSVRHDVTSTPTTNTTDSTLFGSSVFPSKAISTTSSPVQQQDPLRTETRPRSWSVSEDDDWIIGPSMWESRECCQKTFGSAERHVEKHSPPNYDPQVWESRECCKKTMESVEQPVEQRLASDYGPPILETCHGCKKMMQMVEQQLAQHVPPNYGLPIWEAREPFSKAVESTEHQVAQHLPPEYGPPTWNTREPYSRFMDLVERQVAQQLPPKRGPPILETCDACKKTMQVAEQQLVQDFQPKYRPPIMETCDGCKKTMQMAEQQLAQHMPPTYNQPIWGANEPFSKSVEFIEHQAAQHLLPKYDPAAWETREPYSITMELVERQIAQHLPPKYGLPSLETCDGCKKTMQVTDQHVPPKYGPPVWETRDPCIKTMDLAEEPAAQQLRPKYGPTISETCDGCKKTMQVTDQQLSQHLPPKYGQPICESCEPCINSMGLAEKPIAQQWPPKYGPPILENCDGCKNTMQVDEQQLAQHAPSKLEGPLLPASNHTLTPLTSKGYIQIRRSAYDDLIRATTKMQGTFAQMATMEPVALPLQTSSNVAVKVGDKNSQSIPEKTPSNVLEQNKKSALEMDGSSLFSTSWLHIGKSGIDVIPAASYGRRSLAAVPSWPGPVAEMKSTTTPTLLVKDQEQAQAATQPKKSGLLSTSTSFALKSEPLVRKRSGPQQQSCGAQSAGAVGKHGRDLPLKESQLSSDTIHASSAKPNAHDGSTAETLHVLRSLHEVATMAPDFRIIEQEKSVQVSEPMVVNHPYVSTSMQHGLYLDFDAFERLDDAPICEGVMPKTQVHLSTSVSTNDLVTAFTSVPFNSDSTSSSRTVPDEVQSRTSISAEPAETKSLETVKQLSVCLLTLPRVQNETKRGKSSSKPTPVTPGISSAVSRVPLQVGSGECAKPYNPKPTVGEDVSECKVLVRCPSASIESAVNPKGEQAFLQKSRSEQKSVQTPLEQPPVPAVRTVKMDYTSPLAVMISSDDEWCSEEQNSGKHHAVHDGTSTPSRGGVRMQAPKVRVHLTKPVSKNPRVVLCHVDGHHGSLRRKGSGGNVDQDLEQVFPKFGVYSYPISEAPTGRLYEAPTGSSAARTSALVTPEYFSSPSPVLDSATPVSPRLVQTDSSMIRGGVVKSRLYAKFRPSRASYSSALHRSASFYDSVRMYGGTSMSAEEFNREIARQSRVPAHCCQTYCSSGALETPYKRYEIAARVPSGVSPAISNLVADINKERRSSFLPTMKARNRSLLDDTFPPRNRGYEEDSSPQEDDHSKREQGQPRSVLFAQEGSPKNTRNPSRISDETDDGFQVSTRRSAEGRSNISRSRDETSDNDPNMSGPEEATDPLAPRSVMRTADQKEQGLAGDEETEAFSEQNENIPEVKDGEDYEPRHFATISNNGTRTSPADYSGHDEEAVSEEELLDDEEELDTDDSYGEDSVGPSTCSPTLASICIDSAYDEETAERYGDPDKSHHSKAKSSRHGRRRSPQVTDDSERPSVDCAVTTLKPWRSSKAKLPRPYRGSNDEEPAEVTAGTSPSNSPAHTAVRMIGSPRSSTTPINMERYVTRTPSHTRDTTPPAVPRQRDTGSSMRQTTVDRGTYTRRTIDASTSPAVHASSCFERRSSLKTALPSATGDSRRAVAQGTSMSNGPSATSRTPQQAPLKGYRAVKQNQLTRSRGVSLACDFRK